MVFIPQYEQQSATPFAAGGEVPVDGQIGRAVQGLGAQAHETVSEIIDLDDHMAAQAAQKVLGDKGRDLNEGSPDQPGLFYLNGKDAMARAPEVIRQLDLTRAEQKAKLKTGGAQRLFGQTSDDWMGVTRDRVGDHVRQAVQKDRSDMATAGIEAGITSLADAQTRGDANEIQFAAKNLRTLVHIAATSDANGNPELQRLNEDNYLAGAVEKLILRLPPTEAARALATFGPDASSPYHSGLSRVVNDRMRGSVAFALVKDDQPAAWFGPAAGMVWAQGKRDARGMYAHDVVMARTKAYEDAANLSIDERQALEAAVEAAYGAQYSDAERNTMIEVRRAGDKASRYKKDPAATSLAGIGALTGAARTLGLRMLAQGGPPPHDDAATLARIQGALAHDAAAIVNHLPAEVALHLSPASMDRLEALRDTTRDGGVALARAVTDARLGDSVSHEALAIMRIHPDEPAGLDVRAGLAQRIQVYRDKTGETPSLKDARQWANELVVMHAHAPRGADDDIDGDAREGDAPASDAAWPDGAGAGVVDGLGRRQPGLPRDGEEVEPALTDAKYIAKQTRGPPYEVKHDVAARVVFNETEGLTDIPSDPELAKLGIDDGEITIDDARCVISDVVYNRGAAGLRGGMEDDTLVDRQVKSMGPGGVGHRAWVGSQRAAEWRSNRDYTDRMPGALYFLMGSKEAVSGSHLGQRYSWVLGPYRNSDGKETYIGVYGPNPPVETKFW